LEKEGRKEVVKCRREKTGEMNFLRTICTPRLERRKRKKKSDTIKNRRKREGKGGRAEG